MKFKLLKYAIINKYPLFCFIAGAISIFVAVNQNYTTNEMIVMTTVFGTLIFLTVLGIYLTRYFTVKNILETLQEQKQLPATLVDASRISFVYKESDYIIHLDASKGTLFLALYKNGKLLTNQPITHQKGSLKEIVALLDSNQPFLGKKHKFKMKSKWL